MYDSQRFTLKRPRSVLVALSPPKAYAFKPFYRYQHTEELSYEGTWSSSFQKQGKNISQNRPRRCVRVWMGKGHFQQTLSGASDVQGGS